MKLPHPLQGSRITVRNYEVSDKDFCAGLWFDPENGHYLSAPTADFVDALYRSAMDALENNIFTSHLILEADSQPVGTCYLLPDGDSGVLTSATVSANPAGGRATARKP